MTKSRAFYVEELLQRGRTTPESGEGLRQMSRKKITILGLGSLLSERSARTTFPELTGFRLAMVSGYRRSFSHPAAIFFKRNIADLEKKRFCSLSAEECDGASFVCTAFEVDDVGMDAFREREEEYRLEMVKFSVPGHGIPEDGQAMVGLLCCRTTDDEYILRWGKELSLIHI